MAVSPPAFTVGAEPLGIASESRTEASVRVAVEANRFVDEAVVEKKLEDVALPNVCPPVHVFAEARFRPIVLAVAPLYVPEKVRVESVAVRLARDTSPADTVAQVAPPTASNDLTN